MASPRSGMPAWSRAIRSSRSHSPAVRRRGSSSARRCCRPTRAIRSCRPTAPLRSSTRWVGPGFTLGIGPSHEPLIRGVFGLSYDHPGRSTEEYVRILAGALRGEAVDFDGADWSAHTAGRMAPRRAAGTGARLGTRPAVAARRGRARRRNRAVDGTSRARSSRTSHRGCTPRRPQQVVRRLASSPDFRLPCTTTRPRRDPPRPPPRRCTPGWRTISAS